MTQVVGSSSVRGSQVAADQPKVFDIGTEAGMLFLLRAIHRSTLKQVVKNQLRDTLFDFKKGDSKQFAFVKKVLEDAGFSVMMSGEARGDAQASVATASAASSTKTGSIGRVRRTPTFAQPVVAATVTSPSPIPVVKPAEPTPAPIVAPVASTPPPPPPPPVPAPAPAPVAEPAVAPIVEVAAPIPVGVDVVPSPAAVVPPAPIAPPSSPIPVAPVIPSVSPEGATAMERIKEIKHTINEKVGNPVTLIDIDNQIGREYMNALLNAMKAINGGRPEDVASTMERLEKAYVAAMALTKDRPTPPPAAQPVAPAPVAVAPIVSQPPVAPVPPAPITPQPPVGLDAVTPLRPAGSGLSGTPVKLNIAVTPADVAERSSQGFANPEPVATRTSLTMPPPEPAVSVPIMSKLADAQSALRSEVIASPAVAVPTPSVEPMTPTEASQPSRLMSVAKEEQLQNLMRQNQIKEAQKNKTFESQDRSTMEPIMLPEVTAGLKQLLSEWGLFKGSGFFGTGPSGVDHPLYKQIAGLTMAAVIAGRFEGATPSVKQSITDYMNGWRYEEGIVHEHTETFEHYLRRVIKHILDQKGIVR